MFRPLNPPRTRRRAAILIVVLALLALFAVVGISFVFYADGEANAARVHREGTAAPEPGPPDAGLAVNGFLGAFIFGRFGCGLFNRSLDGLGLRLVALVVLSGQLVGDGLSLVSRL